MADSIGTEQEGPRTLAFFEEAQRLYSAALVARDGPAARAQLRILAGMPDDILFAMEAAVKARSAGRCPPPRPASPLTGDAD